MKQSHTPDTAIDSPQAAWRLLTTLLLMLLGNSGMYVVSVVLPAVQTEFGVSRADASIPYTLSMLGFGIGGMWMGRWADRFGIARVLGLGAVGVAAGFVLAGNAWNIPELQAELQHLQPSTTCLIWPQATALLRLGAAAWARGEAVAAELALPVYVRDQVALTTAERLALKAGVA